MKIDFKNYSLVIFDLDDTLYSEQEYLLKAYLEISKFVGNEFKHVKQNEAYSFFEGNILH